MRLACKFHTMTISWYQSIKLIFIRIGSTDFFRPLQYSWYSVFFSHGRGFLENCRCDLQTTTTSFTFHHYEPIGAIDFEFGSTNFLKMMVSACNLKRELWARGFSRDLAAGCGVFYCAMIIQPFKIRKLCCNQRCRMRTRLSDLKHLPTNTQASSCHSSSQHQLHAPLCPCIAHNCICRYQKFIWVHIKSVWRESLFVSFDRDLNLTETDLKRADTELWQAREASAG